MNIQSKIVSISVVLVGLMVGVVSALQAQDRWPGKTFDEKMDSVERGFDTWDSLSPAQQEAAAAQARGTFEEASRRAKTSWAKMTPEEQQAAKESAVARSKDAARDWQALPEEEQERRKGEVGDLIRERRQLRD